MNSPLVLFKDTFPQEILNHIQEFMINDSVYEALRKYFNKLYYKKELHEEYIWDKYVYPKCYCNNCPDNGVNKIFKRKDCDECFKFQSTLVYMPEDFQLCIWDNNQFQKIYYNSDKKGFNYEISIEQYCLHDDYDYDHDDEYYEYEI